VFGHALQLDFKKLNKRERKGEWIKKNLNIIWLY
jgi:hypothetical protein